MGVNNDSTADNSEATQTVPPDSADFCCTVIEHLSWDAYDKEKKCFTPCDSKNKPIANRALKVKMPSDSIVPMTTDANGYIEIKGEKANAKFEITFEPENAKLNNKFLLFHNDIAVIKPLEAE
ncbi:hypothetical protein [Pelotalea chapellei]|uniref:Uncharacterized protein n=1 Tax=Pelotalea chapellei TaxID=44671 RepID=A0ABS5UBB3_9BACT|nr:hypothetical protein [Pelotalea chapellei]MBT1072766.1 hypothetical protein [Pelotalea chapellei]